MQKQKKPRRAGSVRLLFFLQVCIICYKYMSMYVIALIYTYNHIYTYIHIYVYDIWVHKHTGTCIFISFIFIPTINKYLQHIAALEVAHLNLSQVAALQAWHLPKAEEEAMMCQVGGS